MIIIKKRMLATRYILSDRVYESASDTKDYPIDPADYRVSIRII